MPKVMGGELKFLVEKALDTVASTVYERETCLGLVTEYLRLSSDVHEMSVRVVVRLYFHLRISFRRCISSELTLGRFCGWVNLVIFPEMKNL